MSLGARPRCDVTGRPTPAPSARARTAQAAPVGFWEADVATGRWLGTSVLDAILGIDSAFDRSADGWASLVHPTDRGHLLAHLRDEVLGQGQPLDREYRIVRPGSGEVRRVHGQGAIVLGAPGRAARLLGTLTDVTDQHGARRPPVSHGHRYAAIVEGTAEAIVVAEVASRRILWANGAACTMLGYRRDDLVGMSVGEIHPARELPAVLERFEAIAAGRSTVARRVPVERPDGTVRLADIRASLALVDGVACSVGFFADVTEQAAAEAEREVLLEGLRRSERNLAEAQRIAHIGSWEWDLATGVAQRSDELHRIYGAEPGTIPGASEAFLAFVHPDDRARVQAAERAAVAEAGGYRLDYRALRPDGSVRVIHDEGVVVRDASGAPARMVGTVQDVTERRAAARERARLAAAVEQASDSIVVTDGAGTIEYVNPSFERMSGYRAADVIGRNPRLLKSGRQSAAFYRALWRRLSGGSAWSGRFFNRRADGALYEVEATISPIRAAEGEMDGYIAVERDVTALQAARSSLASEFRERAQVAAALARLQPGATVHETAAMICDEIVGLPGIDLVSIFAFPDEEHATVLASAGAESGPLPPGRPLPAARAAYLRGRAAQGPWAEPWRTRPEDGEYGKQIAALGLRASAFAPIRNGEGLLGVVAIGTTAEAYARHLIDHHPVVGEFAAAASALLAQGLEGGRRASRRRASVAAAIDGGAFSPVFQPIVRIDGGATVGHEALTRFADGKRPDLAFAEAWAVGLGADLELATLGAAIARARSLPLGGWLDVNVSPRLLADPGRVRDALAMADRPLVVEITEHDTVDDYRALRAAIASLGEGVRTAVDDAGAGIANFAHIVELRPDFVKLDVGLVRGVEADPGRQAIVVAMQHFASAAGCRLIAEGVETEADAAALASLGVELAQGYWYGRPAPVADLVELLDHPA